MPTHYRDMSGACVPCDKMNVAWLQLAGTLIGIPMLVVAIVKVDWCPVSALHVSFVPQAACSKQSFACLIAVVVPAICLLSISLVLSCVCGCVYVWGGDGDYLR